MTKKNHLILIIVAAVLLVGGGATAAITYYDSTHLKLHDWIKVDRIAGYYGMVAQHEAKLAEYHIWLYLGIALAVIGLAGLITLLCVKPKKEIQA